MSEISRQLKRKIKKFKRMEELRLIREGLERRIIRWQTILKKSTQELETAKTPEQVKKLEHKIRRAKKQIVSFRLHYQEVEKERDELEKVKF